MSVPLLSLTTAIIKSKLSRWRGLAGWERERQRQGETEEEESEDRTAEVITSH